MSTLTTKSDYFKDRASAADRSFDPLAKYSRTGLEKDNKLTDKVSELSLEKSSGIGRSGSSASMTEGFVGYANIPNQIYRRAVKRGFEFNLMVVGESGMGKSTLLNSLFLSELYNADHLGPSKRIKKTVYTEAHTVLLKENSVHLRLGLVDTPGFGDAVDNSNCWQPITDYVDARFEEHLTFEQRVNRSAFVDSRVHACLYFIAPTGHGLKPLDVECMKRLHDKVNIIPIIAKADTMTPEELRDFKKTVMNEITQHKIRVYEFPESHTEQDDEEGKSKRLKERVPFAIVGANCLVEGRSGSKVRGRSYPWGTVEVENLEHNDFLALRNLLIRSHMHDLREVTHNVHYENYRYAKLSGIAQESKFKTTDGKDPMTQMEGEKRDHEAKMRKMETEMEGVFEMKVKEKKQKLKDSEADLQRRADQMRKQLEQQEAELEARRREFEAERRAWESSGSGGDLDRRRSLEQLGPSVTEHVKEKSKTEKKKGLFK